MPKPKTNAGKRWKAAPSKQSATTASKRAPAKARAPKFLETLEERKSRGEKIVALLHEHYPDAECSLEHLDPFQLLISTILSAQCTDARVNMVTPHLFKKFPGPAAMSGAPIEDIEEIIRSTGFFHAKAKNIKAASQKIITAHQGQVPSTLEELTSLAGVGRKTANVVLGNAFGVPGMVVDTHVGRISYRLGLAVSKQAKAKNPEVIERELEEVIEKKEWVEFSHLLISHGRAICLARGPRCHQCFLAKLCPRMGVE
ncbi:MAG: endonuclease III [Bdellovibrionia bacterium]